MPLLDPFLLELLRCPCPRHADLSEDDATSQLVCQHCKLRFAVRDDIPNMILEEAIVTTEYDASLCGAPQAVGANTDHEHA